MKAATEDSVKVETEDAKSKDTKEEKPEDELQINHKKQSAALLLNQKKKKEKESCLHFAVLVLCSTLEVTTGVSKYFCI
jgi:hypothetical protein